MATNVYLYANGNDPFVFPLGDYIVHVYAGAPPSMSPGPVAEPPNGPKVKFISGPEVQPETPFPPVTAFPIRDKDEMRDWLSEVKQTLGDQPARFRLDAVSGPSRPEIHTLLEGLQDLGEHEVSVDIVGWSEPGDG
jgi:hypothetical protein